MNINTIRFCHAIAEGLVNFSPTQLQLQAAPWTDQGQGQAKKGVLFKANK